MPTEVDARPAGGEPLQASYPLSMVLALLVFVVTREAAVLALVAVIGIGALTLRARDRWTRAAAGPLGWANALTWLRILACLVLLLRIVDGRAAVLLAFAIFALDGVDGAVARRRGTSSAFGAELDKECDALFVLTLSALLWLPGLAGLWVLVAGLWRYLYGVIVASSAHAGLRPAPRSQLARYSYSTSSCALMAALYPGNPMAVELAALACVIITASFARSLYYALPRS